jgi:tRNA G18 (ribose-2'-O)-methylase SpoU
MIIKEITSRSNATFKMFIKLLSGQGVKKQGLALISGPKQIREVLRDFPERCGGLIATKDHPASLEGVREDTLAYRVSDDLFQQIDVHGTDYPILLVRVTPFSVWDPGEEAPGCSLFIPFQDPVNVGAVIRSAAAFGAARVVLLNEAAHPFHHKSARVAGSTLLRIPLLEGPPIRELIKSRFPIITLSAQGKDIAQYRFPSTFGLLPGLEGPGLPTELMGFTALSIPMETGVESLNAALATGIALYVWRSRAREAGC